MIGHTISHYRILDKLGEGGMGVVYQARDTTLDRVVALKFLAPHLVSNSEVRKRFIREAKTAAALQHPNICTVFEIGEAGGHTFIAMACLEGRELADEIAAGPLEPDRALDLAIDFAEGLTEAHSKGIVHRDIKPANLFVTSTRRGIILDFGLAQFASADSRLTREGSTLGTCAYMSPEQATGAVVDAQTDVWALGCVLYEMLAGHPPFRGHYDQAIVYSILNQEPEPLGIGAPGLEEVVGKALSKKPQDRYADAGQLLGALKRLDTAGKRPAAASEDAAASQVQSIAVLPFENRSRDEDDEYFSDGVTEDIISALAKIEGLRVTPRTSAFYFKGKAATVKEMAAQLNVDAVLTGTVRRARNRLRITTELIRVQDETQMWSERYDRVLEDIFDIQDEISRAIAEELRAKLAAPVTGQPRRRNPDFEAYRLYLQARQHIFRLTGSSIRTGVMGMQSALGVNPDYAEARAALGFGIGALGVVGVEPPVKVMERARREALRAIDVDETIALAHATLGLVQWWFDWDLAVAEGSYRRAIALDPADAAPMAAFGELLAQMGRVPEALDMLREAVTVDPLSAYANRIFSHILNYSGDFEAALRQAERTLEIEPNHVPAFWHIAFACCSLGRPLEGVERWKQAPAAALDHPISLGTLGACYGEAGDEAAARRVIGDLERMREHSCSPICIAWVCMSIGDLDSAFQWADKAIEERDGLILMLKHYPFPPRAAKFREDPRFDALVQRIGHPD